MDSLLILNEMEETLPIKWHNAVVYINKRVPKSRLLVLKESYLL